MVDNHINQDVYVGTAGNGLSKGIRNKLIVVSFRSEDECRDYQDVYVGTARSGLIT